MALSFKWTNRSMQRVSFENWNIKMLSAIFCILLSSSVYSDSRIQQIPAPNLNSRQYQPWRENENQIQPRTDPGKLESLLDIKNLFTPGFGIFKNIIPTQLSIRPERDARYSQIYIHQRTYLIFLSDLIPKQYLLSAWPYLVILPLLLRSQAILASMSRWKEEVWVPTVPREGWVVRGSVSIRWKIPSVCRSIGSVSKLFVKIVIDGLFL